MKKVLASTVLFIFFFAHISLTLGAEPKEPVRLEEVVVTATKTSLPLSQVPASLHVIDQKEIEIQPNYYVSNYGELIKDLPGVHAGQYFPWGPPWVHLRGTGYFIGRTGFLVDGVPVTPFLSTVVNNHDLKRTEVLLGPSSAVYGANAMGGVVNLITKTGEDIKGMKIEMGYGSRNTFRPHIELGDKRQNVNFYFSYSGDYSDGYRMNPLPVVWRLYKYGKTGWLSYASLKRNDYENSHYAFKLGWDNEKGEGFWLGYNLQRLFLDGGRPNRVWLRNGEQGIGNIRFYKNIEDYAKLTLTMGYQHLDRPGPYDNRGAIIQAGNLVGWNHSPTTASMWKQKRYPFEAQLDISLRKNSIFTLGLFWMRDKEKRWVESRITKAVNSESEYTTDQWAIYIQNQSSFLDDRLNILLGIRHDEWKYHDIFDLLSTPQHPDSISKERTTFRGGLRYKFSDSLSVKASAGTGFWPGLPVWLFQNTRTGSTWREANPGLKPEKTWMVDGGFELNLSRYGTYLSLCGYYGEISDAVSYRYDPHPTIQGVNIVRTLNLAGARIRGLELGIDQRLNEQIKLFLSFTLNDSEITKDPTLKGNELRNSPDYWGTVGFLYTNPKLINGRLALRFSDERYYDDENTPLPYYHMRKYAVLDAKIWKDFKIGKSKVLTLSLSGENLNNQKYETEFVYIHPGRSIQFNAALKYNF
ncbi:MAG: TonB-dependent receptor [Deltaproteobacteria bacterium]|nr:TonB-dependent receptor [Deltaproteobacteria bacterium]